MSEDRETLRAISWPEVFPSSILLNAFSLAFNFRTLLLTAMGLVATVAGWRVAGQMLDPPADSSVAENQSLEKRIAEDKKWPWATVESLPYLSSTPSDPPRSSGPPAIAFADGIRNELPGVSVGQQIVRPWLSFFSRHSTPALMAYSLICASWSLVVWSIFGGAVTRFAALALTTGERISIRTAIGFAVSKWGSYFAASALPLAGVCIFAIPLALLGALLHFNVGIVIAGLAWFVVILGGLMMALLLVGLFFGWPLLWCSVSTEGTDAFDALSRTFAYTFQRPVQYLRYVIFAALLGLFGWLLMQFFTTAVLELGFWAVSWGSGSEQLGNVLATDSDNATVAVGASLIGFWTNAINLLAASFTSGMLWTSATAVYLLMRRNVDATEMDEVFEPQDLEPERLPPLDLAGNASPDVASPDVANASSSGPEAG